MQILGYLMILSFVVMSAFIEIDKMGFKKYLKLILFRLVDGVYIVTALYLAGIFK